MPEPANQAFFELLFDDKQFLAGMSSSKTAVSSFTRALTQMSVLDDLGRQFFSLISGVTQFATVLQTSLPVVGAVAFAITTLIAVLQELFGSYERAARAQRDYAAALEQLRGREEAFEKRLRELRSEKERRLREEQRHREQFEKDMMRLSDQALAQEEEHAKRLTQQAAGEAHALEPAGQRFVRRTLELEAMKQDADFVLRKLGKAAHDQFLENIDRALRDLARREIERLQEIQKAKDRLAERDREERKRENFERIKAFQEFERRFIDPGVFPRGDIERLRLPQLPALFGAQLAEQIIGPASIEKQQLEVAKKQLEEQKKINANLKARKLIVP